MYNTKQLRQVSDNCLLTNETQNVQLTELHTAELINQQWNNFTKFRLRECVWAHHGSGCKLDDDVLDSRITCRITDRQTERQTDKVVCITVMGSCNMEAWRGVGAPLPPVFCTPRHPLNHITINYILVNSLVVCALLTYTQLSYCYCVCCILSSYPNVPAASPACKQERSELKC